MGYFVNTVFYYIKSIDGRQTFIVRHAWRLAKKIYSSDNYICPSSSDGGFFSFMLKSNRKMEGYGEYTSRLDKI